MLLIVIDMYWYDTSIVLICNIIVLLWPCYWLLLWHCDEYCIVVDVIDDDLDIIDVMLLLLIVLKHVSIDGIVVMHSLLFWYSVIYVVIVLFHWLIVVLRYTLLFVIVVIVIDDLVYHVLLYLIEWFYWPIVMVMGHCWYYIVYYCYCWVTLYYC